MIVEVGLFRIDHRRAGGFAPVAYDIRAAFVRGGIPGPRFFRMTYAVEDAGRWAVLAGWDSISDHQKFVASYEGERQGALLARFMTETPELFHLSFDEVVEELQ